MMRITRQAGASRNAPPLTATLVRFAPEPYNWSENHKLLIGVDEPDWLDELPIPEPPQRDPAVDRAIERVRAFLNESPNRVFYSTQIETSLERDFFHWITGKALLELGNSHEIQRIRETVAGQNINFYANRRHRYVKREIKGMLKLLERMYDPEFTHAIGRHGEQMFDVALARIGFRYEARDTREWNGATWAESNLNSGGSLTL